MAIYLVLVKICCFTVVGYYRSLLRYVRIKNVITIPVIYISKVIKNILYNMSMATFNNYGAY